MVYVFLADGFEEIEALAPVDVLRRGGVAVKTVGVGKRTVTGSHNISVLCDISEDEVNFADIDAVILPGGMPGTLNLQKSDKVIAAIEDAQDKGKLIGAICAAPSILGKMGILNGKKATCFPGFEEYLKGAILTDLPAVRDGNIITSRGAGAAFDFGFLLLSALTDSKTAEKLSRDMKYI